MLFGSLLLVSGALPDPGVGLNKFFVEKKESMRKKERKKEKNKLLRTNLSMCLPRRCLEEVRKAGLPGMVQNSPSSKRITGQLKFSKVKTQGIKLVDFRAGHFKNQYDSKAQARYLPSASSFLTHSPWVISSISTSSHPFQLLPIIQGLLNLRFSCHPLPQP